MVGTAQARLCPFQSETGRVPGLAVVLVGSDPASEIYVRNKGRKALELGMESFQHILPENTTQEHLLELVAELNANDAVDGILVQLPLPKHIDELAVVSAVDPGKDVDGLHVVSAGRLVAGLPCMTSCTPLGCLMLLKDQLGDLSGLDAIVIGRSILVGKPMGQLLLGANCTVTMAHSRTRNLAPKQADIAGRCIRARGDDQRFDCSKTDMTGAGYFGFAIEPTATPIIEGKLVTFQ